MITNNVVPGRGNIPHLWKCHYNRNLPTFNGYRLDTNLGLDRCTCIILCLKIENELKDIVICVHVYIHTYIHTYIHIFYRQINRQTHTYKHKHEHVYIHLYNRNLPTFNGYRLDTNLGLDRHTSIIHCLKVE